MPPASPGAVDSADVFRRAWSVYEQFLTHNWMRHREVYAAFRDVARRTARPCSVADLGSANGRCTLAALAGVPLTRYVAVDRVRGLLEEIPPQLVGTGCRVELIEDDLAHAVARPMPEPVDLLLAAYSVHHLQTPQKARFFVDAAGWIAPRGRLVLIDLLRRPDESRRRYLDRFHRHAARCFGAFTPAARLEVQDHMEACDFPETAATLTDLCTAASFAAPRLVYRDPEELYGVFCTTRLPAG